MYDKTHYKKKKKKSDMTEWISTASIYVCVYTYIYTHLILFIHSSGDEHLGCLYILATIHNAHPLYFKILF